MARVRIPVVAIAGNATIANASMAIRNRDTGVTIPVYAAETGGTTLTLAQQVSDAFGRFPGWTDAPLPIEATITPPGGSGLAPWVESWDAAPAGPGDVIPPWLDVSTLTQGLRSTLALRPAPAALPDGVTFTSSDLGGEWIVFAGAWVPIGPMRGTLAQRNAIAGGNLIAGDRFEATDDWGGTLHHWTGAAWTVVWSKNEKVLTFANQASQTFTGLDGDADELYMLVWALTQLTTGTIDLALRFNGVATNTYAYLGGHTGGAGYVNLQGGQNTVNRAILIQSDGGLAQPLRHTGKSIISAKSGAHRTVSSEHYSSFQRQGNIGSSWSTTTGNVTTIDLLSTVGNLTGTAVLRRMKTP